jgi:hypothetical protein
MRMTRDKLRALGQRRSFKVDGFELDKGTREHPGRRLSREAPSTLRGCLSTIREESPSLSVEAASLSEMSAASSRQQRKKSSVQFAIPPELDQPPRPLLGNVSKDTRKSMRMTRDKLRALGQRRSFKVDGFELEKGTREHPGRRMSHGPRDGKQIRAPVLTNVPLAAAPGPSSAPSSAQDRRPSVQLTSPAEQTQPPRPLLGNVSKDTRKSMRMTRDKLRALGQRRSFKMDGFSDVVTRERPGKLSERKVGASARASSQRPVSPPRGSQTQQQPYGVDVDALPRESNDEMDDSPAGELSVLADARPKRRKRRMRRDAAAVVEV